MGMEPAISVFLDLRVSRFATGSMGKLKVSAFPRQLAVKREGLA
jgi:hypothetical protein